jgi:hypothetical protein
MIMVTTQFENTTQNVPKNLRYLMQAKAFLYDKEYPNIVDQMDANYQTEKMMNYEGPGALSETPEGGSPEVKSLIEGYTESVHLYQYMMSMNISYMLQEFGNVTVPFLNMVTDYISRAVLLRQEYTGAAPINNGFTTGLPNSTGGDGQPLYSATHTYRVGTSYSNLLSAADLDKTSLEDAIIATHTQVRENNIQAALKIDRVTVAPQNTLKISELLKSTMDPESGNNTYNAIRDFGIGKFVSHYMSDLDQWVVDTKEKARIMYKRSGAKMWSKTEENGDLKEVVCLITGSGFYNQFATFANQGA